MHKRAWILLILATTVATGCGKKPGLATYPVTGTVTYNGKPVANALVSYFVNVDAPASTGMTDTDGKFTLATHVSTTQVLPGAPPGDYKVTITKNSGSTAGESLSEMENMDPEARRRKMIEMMGDPRAGQGQQAQGAPPKPKPEIPIKYAKSETSGLSATVLSGENPPKEFKLTDD